MQSANYGYGLWALAVLNSAVFIFFAWSFFKPLNRRDWRSLGLYSAFVIALFAEMYGFPLTIYLLSGWLTTRFPEVNWLSHDAGHLLETLFGWRVNPHFGLFHLMSFVFIFAGFAPARACLARSVSGAARGYRRNHRTRMCAIRSTSPALLAGEG
jgi:hypothetical protein